jgi:hypothetical protein
MTTECTADTSLEKRVAYLKRIFARGFGKTPSARMKLALHRAALMTAKAELALANPLTSANDCIRLDGAAARARADLQKLVSQRVPQTEMTLAKYAALQSRKAAP